MPNQEPIEKHEGRSTLTNIALTASLLASMSLPVFERNEAGAAERSAGPVPALSGAQPVHDHNLFDVQFQSITGRLPTAYAASAPVQDVKVAPDFSLKDLDGNTITLSGTLKQNEGKVVLLKFGASWCPPCRASTEQLKEMHEKYGKQLVILDVNNRESAEVAREYAREHGTKYKTLLDSDGAVGQSYDVTGLPTFALIKIVDGKPKMVLRTVGYDSSPEAKQAFEAQIVKHFNPNLK